MAPELLAVNASSASAAADLRPIQRKLMPPPAWGSKVVFRFAIGCVPSLHVGGMLFLFLLDFCSEWYNHDREKQDST
ncbi:hypothetical protein SDC9_106414 [bioreactor metagenome]|uniref:Uncharacterized protein n=1 Tax=bioreactor metagenome TaxID=1076179 RepID=A0A645B296_9ZZZZ